MIPHGIYDEHRNAGYLTLGTSRDTSELACESLKQWWQQVGQFDYPEATALLALCDCGGSNNARHYIFKQDLQNLANELGLEIRIAHFPPYTSKYNPIEHRLFPHLTRAWQGVIFTSLELVKKLAERTKTKTGLSVVAQVLDKVFETGREATQAFKQSMPILFDEYLPQWNYRAIPQSNPVAQFI